MLLGLYIFACLKKVNKLNYYYLNRPFAIMTVYLVANVLQVYYLYFSKSNKSLYSSLVWVAWVDVVACVVLQWCCSGVAVVL